jgi:hypothetical protein
MRVSARKMDRWWMIIVAFLIAAGMVLLVVLTMNAGTADGATPRVRQHIAAPVHLRHSPWELRRHHLTWTHLFIARAGGDLFVPDA